MVNEPSVFDPLKFYCKCNVLRIVCLRSDTKKTTNWHVRPAVTQISLGISVVLFTSDGNFFRQNQIFSVFNIINQQKQRQRKSKITSFANNLSILGRNVLSFGKKIIQRI